MRNSQDRDLIRFIHFSDRCGDAATTDQRRASAANGAGNESFSPLVLPDEFLEEGARRRNHSLGAQRC
jgi:hypothetical protein